jgi:hypothetical protein
MDKLNEELQVMLNLIYKSKHGVCLSDKQGRAGQGRLRLHF